MLMESTVLLRDTVVGFLTQKKQLKWTRGSVPPINFQGSIFYKKGIPPSIIEKS